MKKTLLLSCALGLGAAAFAAEPVILPEFYSMKISPDGSVIVSQTDGAVSFYDVKQGKITAEFEYFYLGQGNCMTPDGSTLVGSTEMDRPVIVKNGEMVDLEGVGENYKAYCFNAITADGKRLVGYVSNNSEEENETTWVPMYVEVGADGKLGEPVLLPYPKKDWAGLDPQFVAATYISNDGKTILGQLMDNTGGVCYPVLFKEGTDGKWNYSLPTESLINPEKLPIPEYPGEFDLLPPKPENYMSADQKAKYMQAMDDWAANGYNQDEYPEPGNYMTQEQAEAYNAAAEEYNKKAQEYNDKLEAYFTSLEAIMESSVFFLQNGYAMDADGKIMAISGQKDIINEANPWWPETTYPAYIFNLETNEMRAIEHTTEGYPVPSQVLKDGSVIGVTPLDFFGGGLPPQSYVIAPGSTVYTPIEDYIAPADAAWLKEKFTKNIVVGYDYDPETYDETPIFADVVMTGHACVSEDWKVISGGVLAYQYSEENVYESYVIQPAESGVANIDADAEVKTVTYYDLNGFEVKNPSKGIYVSRTVYSDGTVLTGKVAVK